MHLDNNILMTAGLGCFLIVFVTFAIVRGVNSVLVLLLALSAAFFALAATQLAFNLFIAGEALWPAARRSTITIYQTHNPVAFWLSTSFLWSVSCFVWFLSARCAYIALVRRR